MDSVNLIQQRAQRLRQIRKLLKCTRDRFCQDGPLNLATLGSWERGRYGGLTEEGAKKFLQHAETLGAVCSLHWLLHGIGPEPTLKAKQSEPKDIQDHIVKELLLFREQDNTMDLLVPDNAMAPFYCPGDYVAGIMQPLHECCGQDCILTLESGQVFFRRLQRLEDPNHPMGLCMLTSLNPDTDAEMPTLYQAKVKAAAPVIWIRRSQLKR